MVSYKPSLSKIILIGLVVLAVFVPRATFAAMLAISPESGTYTVGQTFTATVRASSYTQSMNAVSGTLLYPADVLSIVSVSKNNSLLDTWLPPGSSGPVYTTGSGSIHFEGISLGGYKGAPKTIFSVTFKVKQSGVAKLTFQNGTILANDGKGTDITKALADASYKLAKAPAVAVGQILKKANLSKWQSRRSQHLTSCQSYLLRVRLQSVVTLVGFLVDLDCLCSWLEHSMLESFI